MADQDKDRTSPSAGQWAGVVGNPPESRGTAGDLKEAGRHAFDEARHSTQEMAGQMKEQGKSVLEQQKANAAEKIGSAAGAFRSTAEHLQEEGQPQAGRYVNLFAEQLESLGGQLRHKNMDTLIHDAADLGRRSPGALLAGSVVAGFVLARFLKSSAAHRHGSTESHSAGDKSGFGPGAYVPASKPQTVSAAGGAATPERTTGMGERVASPSASPAILPGGTPHDNR